MLRMALVLAVLCAVPFFAGADDDADRVGMRGVPVCSEGRPAALWLALRQAGRDMEAAELLSRERASGRCVMLRGGERFRLLRIGLYGDSFLAEIEPSWSYGAHYMPPLYDGAADDIRAGLDQR